ncbi:hypothetical protein ACI2KR_31075 [Pseudomonas luteola]
MKAYQLNFRLGQRVYPSDARATTAAMLDKFQPGIVGALMHYCKTEKGNEPANGFPPVHFAGLSDGFSLVGFGDLGEMILQDSYAAITRAWADKLSVGVTLDSREIAVGIEPRPYNMSYTIPRVVIQKKPWHLEELKDPQKGPAFVEKLLLRCINTQAEFLGLELPSDIKIAFRGCTGTFAAKLGHGTAALAGMKNLEFEANICLKGMWSFGFIVSKGYGLLNADMARGGLLNASA